MSFDLMAERSAELFVKCFGRAPRWIVAAPGRVNLIGEHTDYNGGYVLPFAIDRRTRVAAARRADAQVSVRSLQRPGDVARASIDSLRPAHEAGQESGWASYVVGVIWALRAAGYDVQGLDIVLDGGVPTGSGLSSSAAMECAVGLAALDLYGIDLDRAELARIAQHAETDYVGVPCGLMDQMAASICRADHALFFDVRDDIREHEPFAPQREGLAILVINTRAQHAHSGGEYAQRRRACEDAAKQLDVAYLRDIPGSGLDAALGKLDDEMLRRRARHVITEDDRVLATVERLRAGRLAEIGPLLTASHVSLRDDFEVSAPELDVTVDAALQAGALGARMTGGGFGGSAIALIRADDEERVREAVLAAFENRGFASPEFLCPTASDGVLREA